MIRVANAPCSWGVLEFDLEGKPAPYAQVLDEMQRCGYAGTELGDWGFLPVDPEKLSHELRSRQLELVGAFVPVAFASALRQSRWQRAAVRVARLMAEAGFDKALLILADDNGTIPLRTSNAGRITAQMGLSPEDWVRFAEGVNLLARTIRRETGLSVAFHHHCAGYVETDAEIRTLIELTDPDLISLVFDTGHYRLGGGDPLTGLRNHFDRIKHVHFKDCSNKIASEARLKSWDYFESVRAGVFCELGQGSVDFDSIIRELRERSYEGWIVVEQDVLPGMGTPKVCARRNRQYLESLGL